MCPKSIVLFTSTIVILIDFRTEQATVKYLTKIIIPLNHLDKLWFKFPEEIIIKFQYFSQKIYKKQNSI